MLEHGEDGNKLVSRMHVPDFRCRKAISGRTVRVAADGAAKVAIAGVDWRFLRERKLFEKVFGRP